KGEDDDLQGLVRARSGAPPNTPPSTSLLSGGKMIREYPNFRITVSTYDLPADQDEIAYLDAVEANLKQIAASVTGQAVLFKIRAHGLVMIVPYTEEYARKNVHGDRCNATSSAILPRKNKADLVAQVAFSPKVFAAQSPCGRGPGLQPD